MRVTWVLCDLGPEEALLQKALMVDGTEDVMVAIILEGATSTEESTTQFSEGIAQVVAEEAPWSLPCHW